MTPILRAGIVGGGRGAFIGTIHRRAAELDGEARLVAGAMSVEFAARRRGPDERRRRRDQGGAAA
jgi:hypothetical protein